MSDFKDDDGFIADDDGFVADDDGFVPDDDRQPNQSSGGYESFAKKALDVVPKIMEIPERYIGAPSRAAVSETIKNPFGFGAIPAYYKQSGEDPKKSSDWWPAFRANGHQCS